MKNKNYRMKKTFIIIFTIFLFIISFSLTSCEDDDSEDLGRQAAMEFCDCLDDGGSLSECNDEFKDKYRYKTDEDFINAFNSEGAKCNINIEED